VNVRGRGTSLSIRKSRRVSSPPAYAAATPVCQPHLAIASPRAKGRGRSGGSALGPLSSQLPCAVLHSHQHDSLSFCTAEPGRSETNDKLFDRHAVAALHAWGISGGCRRTAQVPMEISPPEVDGGEGAGPRANGVHARESAPVR
jgi:hypothetical protein